MSNSNQRPASHALYVRVSTEAQAEEGYSVPAQTERLEAYCKMKGWDNYALYTDAGFSGSNLNRPAVQRLIADVETGKISSVAVYKLDRLSRSQKDTLFLIEDVFLPQNVDFISLNENIDTSTPYGRAMIGILSAFAQLERENIYLRTRMGMLERVKQGFWMGGGGTPFGYDYDSAKGILVPNEDAVVVRKIYELYIKGYSAQKIANMLNLKYDKLVTQILTRRSNLGLISYKGQEYQGLHQPIVTEETFDLAMRKMRERGSSARATASSRHLLTGLVYCGLCGARMRYIKWGKAGYKLRCYSRDPSKSYMRKMDHCDADAVWADQIEQVVLDDLFQLSADMGDNQETEKGLFIDPLAELKSRITQTENKLKRLYNLYAESEDEVLRDAIEEAKKLLLSLRDSYADEESNQTASRQLDLIRCQVAGIAETWPLLSDQERQVLIRDCVEKIVISGTKVEIYYTFKKNGEQTLAA